MNILILGGTRFLGRYLVEAALHKGHNVTLFNRGNNANIFPNVEQLIGDRDGDLDALKGRKWDAVIDTCGFVPRTVTKSSKLLKSIKHYTYISSISVYQDFSELGIDENSEVQTMTNEEVEEITRDTAGPIYTHHYGPLKTLCERAAEKELPGKVLAIRAGQIVGPHDYTDRLPYWVKRISEGGEILAPGRPGRPVQLIDVRDLADWIIKMIEENVTGVFNATGPDYVLTMEQLLKECKTICGSEATFKWVPEGFLMDHKVQPWGEMPLWIPEEFPMEGDEKPAKGFLAVDNRKAINNGLTFRPLSETIMDVLNWEKNRSDKERKSGLNRQKEKELLSNLVR
jgi:2'-hydroxyisoflavone reductase